MKTELKVIDYILFDIYRKAKPLNESIINAQNYFSIIINDPEIIIRQFLVDKKLISHNPRLTVKNVKTEIVKNTYFEQDMIHDDFLNENLTLKGRDLVETSSLSNNEISVLDIFK